MKVFTATFAIGVATGNFETEYPGLNELAQTEEYGDMVVEDMPVGLVFQSYHLMVAMYGLIMLTSILVLVFTFKGGRIAKMRWLQWAAVLSPIWPFIAIQTGWITAEVGASPGWCTRRSRAPTACRC